MSKVCATANGFHYDKPEIRIVTPDIARMLLANSEIKPAISRKQVQDYANEIMTGDWKRTVYSVVMSDDGLLLSGHEYLHATIKAGVPVKFAYEYETPYLPKLNPATTLHDRPPLPDHLRNTSMDWEYVTPEMAKEYLEFNVNNVRKLDESLVEKYARDLREGRWEATHQGISIDEDGNLPDGQHRLSAIVKTGIAAWMMVTRGLRKRAAIATDTGKRRNHKAQAASIGFDINKEHSACAKAMMLFHFDKSTSDQQVIEATAEYMDSISFALSIAKSSYAKNAVVHAVLARAHYAVPESHEDIKRFAAILVNGISTDSKDVAAVVFRNHLMSTNHRVRNGWRAGAPRKSLYLRAEYALNAFLEHRQISKLKEANCELFPLAGGI